MNLSDFLRERRESLGFSQKAVSDDLQLPLKYIIAFETGEWERLPARIYARGFLKKYAVYLELDKESVLTAFDAGWPDVHRGELKAHGVSPVRPHTALLRIRRFLREQKLPVFLVVLGVLAVSMYFAYEFRYALLPPTLVLEEPAGNRVVEDDVIPISGRVEKEADLWLNGRQLYADETGAFRDSALLRKGLNTLVFKAKNRFGKTHIVTRYIVVR